MPIVIQIVDETASIAPGATNDNMAAKTRLRNMLAIMNIRMGEKILKYIFSNIPSPPSILFERLLPPLYYRL